MRPADILPIAALLVGACVADETSRSESRGQGNVAQAALVVNEVAPQVASGPDWLELMNRSEEPVDLCNYFVSDSVDRLDHYHRLAGDGVTCMPTLLQPGDYLIIIADDHPETGPNHAPFKLGLADEVHVITDDGIPIDSLVYLASDLPSTHTLGRTPNGEGLFFPAPESRGLANAQGQP